MSHPDSGPEWSTLEAKLAREKKSVLLGLIRELAAVSSEAEQFLKTRYSTEKNRASSVTSYRRLIKQQFSFSLGQNMVIWDFAAVYKAIDDYEQASQGDESGGCELVIVALETALDLADRLNLQADDFERDVTRLAERCSYQLRGEPRLQKKYGARLRACVTKGSHLGDGDGVAFLEEALI